MKNLIKNPQHIQEIKSFVDGLQHQIDDMNNDPEWVKKIGGKCRMRQIVLGDEFNEQHKAANEMWGAEDAPGPLANVRGVNKPREMDRSKMIDQIRNTKTFKEKFDGKLPVIEDYKSNTFQGHKI